MFELIVCPPLSISSRELRDFVSRGYAERAFFQLRSRSPKARMSPNSMETFRIQVGLINDGLGSRPEASEPSFEKDAGLKATIVLLYHRKDDEVDS